jgi:NADH:ubiquinone oxidoreductase subunit C
VVKDSAKSIIELWPAADWVERETRDYFDLAFEGREETPPLMLRAGDQRGLFKRTAPVGRGADPAYTAKTGEEAR